jgi:copper chaperone CopZ
VRVAVQKLDGVESADVSLAKASADIRLKPGNRVTLAQLRQIIRKNGYPTKDAQVEALGKIVDRNGEQVFDLLNGSTLRLSPVPRGAPASEVNVTGVSRLQARDVDQLTITAIK